MKLGEILEQVPSVEMGADHNAEVTSLAYDSRRVSPRCLFFAIQGEKADGHQYIGEALRRGAVAIVSERAAPPERAAQWVRVKEIRHVLAQAARSFYDYPDLKLRLVGITGTNGKTTTAYLLNSIFQAAGIPSGMLGTIEHRLGDRVLAASNTTPESLDLAVYFSEMIKGGGQIAVMEVSSHALAQERIWGLRYSAAVFTNLTRDHLDYHQDFERYFAAKRRLFEGVGSPPPELAVINVDDEWGRRLLSLPYPRRVTYGFSPAADIRVKEYSQSTSGLSATLAVSGDEMKIQSALLGRVNLMNLLAASATAVGMGIPREQIQEGVWRLQAVPGRFQKIDEGQPFLVVVDYAHTDDALQNVLQTARQLTKNRLIILFGCGGERDRTKRPIMGELAGCLSDLAVLTSDNPRGEDPILILNDVLVGLQKTGKPYVVEVDRKTAIRKALEQAREGDTVVLAGKGHETYQVLRDGPVPFDDREIARTILRELGFQREDAGADETKPSHR